VGGFSFSSKKARTRSTPACWRCSVTLALMPDFHADPEDAFDALLNKAICR
jgi:hypothetical protein